MMGDRMLAQEALFYSFSLERHVPADHLLRSIDRFVDLSAIREQLRPFYSETGRPSIDPELMIRMLVIGYCMGIRSERRLCEEVHLNLAYRWFCRLGLEGDVPDHSTFSKNRHGRFRDSDLLRRLFETTVERCMIEGLVGGEGFAVDASLIRADASRQSGGPGSDGLPPDADARAVREYLAVLDDAAFGAATPVVRSIWHPPIRRRAGRARIAGQGSVTANAPTGNQARVERGMPRPRKPASPFRYFNSSPEVIRLVVMMYVRFPLSLRNVEDLLFERGIDISHETVRQWWNRFGPLFAGDIRRQRVSAMRGFRHWRWHLDEMYVKLNGEMVYLWRAVDQEGEILESFITRTRDKGAALTFMKKALKRHGSPQAITTDGLRSYGAAMRELGNEEKREVGRWANNRVENSHLPFRRRERAMLRFRQMKTLQKFASVHANVHNHFNLERHLIDRQTYKQRRSAALAEWQILAS